MRFNRSVFFSFLFSYLLLMALVLTIFVALLTTTFSEKKEGLRMAHENMIERACGDISLSLDRCTVLMEGYTQDDTIKSLMAAQAKNDRVRTNILTMHQMIQGNTHSQDIYAEIAFYFDKMDLMLSSKGTSETRAYYLAYCADEFEDEQAWIDWVLSLEAGKLYAWTDESIYMGVSLPLIGLEKHHSAAIFRFNTRNLFATLQNAQDLFCGAIAVCDEAGKPLYTLGNDALLNADALEHKNLYHYTVADAGGRFILRSVIEEEALFADASDMLRVYLLVLAVCVLLGVVLSLVMSMRFYQPVRRIATIVGGGENGESNELKHIEKSIQTIIDEREKLNTNLLHHSDDLLDCEFRRVVTGEANKVQAQELIERELAPGDQGLISFVAVGIEGVRRSQFRLLMETVLSQYTRCRCFTVGRIIAGTAVAEDWNTVREQMTGLYDQVSQLGGGTFCMAVSEIVNTPLSLAISHHQAMEALDYGMMVSGEGVTFADALPEFGGQSDSGIALYDHMRLQDAIRSGNADEAMRTFRWMTEKYFPEEGVSLPWLKCRMFNLMNTLVASVSEVRMQSQDEAPVEKLLGSNSVRDMIREAERYLQAVCSQMKDDALIQTPTLGSEQIMEYIKAHHQDPNLNVASVAEHFKLNASYLSRLFKQTTGEGVLDTIHIVRLMHVKQLLRETELSMHDIQQSTGYPSEQTMFRAFKRIEGMTPSQYRQLYQHDEEGE